MRFSAIPLGVVPSSAEYFEDIVNLLIGFQEIRSDKKKEFNDSLKNLSFVLCNKTNSSEHFLARPTEAYFPTNQLVDYFSGFNDVFFVASELYEKLERAEVDQFLVELGVASLPRRIKIAGQLAWPEKSKLHNSIGHTRDIYDHDYDIHGLNHFLTSITKERSILLWDFLIRRIEEFGWRTDEFFKGEYKWYYRTDRTATFDAKFTKELRRVAWLFDQGGITNSPPSIPFSQLAFDYDRKSSASHILIQQLQFKPDVQHQLLQQLSEDDRKKFEVLLGLSSIELDRMVSLVREKESTSTTSHENQPEVRSTGSGH